MWTRGRECEVGDPGHARLQQHWTQRGERDCMLHPRRWPGWARRHPELGTSRWEFECLPRGNRAHTWHSSANGSAIDVSDSQLPSILSHLRNVEV